MNIQTQIDRYKKDYGKCISKYYNDDSMLWELVFIKENIRTILYLDDKGKIKDRECLLKDVKSV